MSKHYNDVKKGKEVIDKIHIEGQVGQYDAESLKKINDLWRELDHLQISTHTEGMSQFKFNALNALDAIGLELTKSVKYPSIGTYIQEKLNELNRALEEMKYRKEII